MASVPIKQARSSGDVFVGDNSAQDIVAPERVQSAPPSSDPQQPRVGFVPAKSNPWPLPSSGAGSSSTGLAPPSGNAPTWTPTQFSGYRPGDTLPSPADLSAGRSIPPPGGRSAPMHYPPMSPYYPSGYMYPPRNYSMPPGAYIPPGTGRPPGLFGPPSSHTASPPVATPPKKSFAVPIIDPATGKPIDFSAKMKATEKKDETKPEDRGEGKPEGKPAFVPRPPTQSTASSVAPKQETKEANKTAPTLASVETKEEKTEKGIDEKASVTEVEEKAEAKPDEGKEAEKAKAENDKTETKEVAAEAKPEEKKQEEVQEGKSEALPTTEEKTLTNTESKPATTPLTRSNAENKSPEGKVEAEAGKKESGKSTVAKYVPPSLKRAQEDAKKEEPTEVVKNDEEEKEDKKEENKEEKEEKKDDDDEDDWEHADEEKLVKKVTEIKPGGRHQYSKDFLLSFMSKHTAKPVGFVATVDLIPGEKDKDDKGGFSGSRRGRGDRRDRDRDRGERDRSGPNLRGSGKVARDKEFGTPGTSSWKDKRGKGPESSIGKASRRGGGGGGRKNQPVLEATEGRWERPGAAHGPMDNLKREIQPILNKLTMDNFGRLLPKLLVLDLKRQEVLELLIECIFHKAIDEPNFVALYVILCLELSQRVAPIDLPPSPDGKVQRLTFRACLLKHCQYTFENRPKVPPLPANFESLSVDEKEAIEYAGVKIRARNVGNVKFIGSLFKKNMITPTVVLQLLIDLIVKGEKYDPEAPEEERKTLEEDLDHFVALLTLAGKRLDTESKESHSMVDLLVKKMKDLVGPSSQLPSRIRFALQNTLDLRARGWINRKGKDIDDAQRPKTIQEVHADEAKRQREKESNVQRIRSGRPPRDSGPYGGAPTKIAARPAQSHVATGGWREVGGATGRGKAPTAATTPVSPSFGRGASKNAASPQVRDSLNRFNLLSSSGGVTDEELVGSPPDFESDEEDENERMISQAIAKSLQKHEGEVGDDESEGGDDESDDEEEAPAKGNVKVTQASKELSDADKERKVKLLIEEYLDAGDVDDALECVNDLREYKGAIDVFYDKAIDKAVDVKSDRERSELSTLVFSLLKDDDAEVESLVAALGRLFGRLEDLLVDFPKALDLVARFLAPSLTAFASLLRETLQISTLADFPQSLTHKLVAALLREMAQENFEGAKASFAEAAKVLEGLIVDLPAFLAEQKLTELMSAPTHSAVPAPSEAKNESEINVREEFESRLKAGESAAAIIEWLPAAKTLKIEKLGKLFDQLVPPLLQHVGTAESSDEETAILKNFTLSGAEAQMELLYALQRWWNDRGNTKGTLQAVMERWYLSKVVTRPGVKGWLDDPEERVAGKSKALFEVSPWWSGQEDKEREAIKREKERAKLEKQGIGSAS